MASKSQTPQKRRSSDLDRDAVKYIVLQGLFQIITSVFQIFLSRKIEPPSDKR